MWVFLDIVVFSFLGIYTFFFLNILNNNNFYYRLFCFLLIDFILINANGIFTLIILFVDLLLKNVKNYYFKNICAYVMFVFLISFLFKENLFNINSLFLQAVFIYLKRMS